MSLILSLFLGLVQGITEFLPISSSGHLSILQNLISLDYAEDNHMFFEVLLHLATMLAIVFTYRKDIKAMISDGVNFLRMRSDSDIDEPVVMKPPARTLLFVIIATIPMIIPLIFHGAISRLFFSTGFIGFALIITGGLLFVSETQIKKGNKTDKTMTLGDAILIGLAQAVAVMPGLSRSGTTIAVGLARGLNGTFVVRFSLLLSIPAVLGATIASAYSAFSNGFNIALLPVYLAGFVIALGVGFFAIQFLRRVVSKGGMSKFAFYCWGIGALAIILSLIV